MTLVYRPDRPNPLEHGLNLYQCGWEACAKGHSFGPAVRDHYLIHCVFKGKGRFYTPEKSYSLEPGQGFLIMPGQITTYTADLLRPWQYGWVGFHGREASDILAACGLSREQPILSFENGEAVRLQVEELTARFEAGAHDFALLAGLYGFFSLLVTSRSGESGSRMLDVALDFIRKNYSYSLSVEGLAARCGVDRSQLFRVFKRYLGLSPQQYIIQYRLERAADLLRSTDLSVTQIQYSCGFGDLSHFSRLFKSRYGISPAAYQRKENGSRPSSARSQ